MNKSWLLGSTFWILILSVNCVIGQEGTAKAQPIEVGKDIGSKIAKENQISIDLFQKIAADKAALESIVLVDVRSESENSVSVIPGAITKAQYEADPKKFAGKTAVCYCLSGGRSGKYVKQL